MQLEADTVTAIYHIVSGLCTVVVGFLSWLWKLQNDRIDEQSETIKDMDLALTATVRELADHKLHVAETYATKAGVEIVVDAIRADLKDVRGDIKDVRNLILQMKPA